MMISTQMHPEFWGVVGGCFMAGAIVLYIKCQLVLNRLAVSARRHLDSMDLLPSGDLPPMQVVGTVSSAALVAPAGSNTSHESSPLLSLNDDTHAQHRRAQHKRLFWFNRPNLLFRLIQLLLLFQSWFVALLFIFLPAEKHDWTLMQIISCFAPPLLTVVTFAPVVLPIFTLIRYVGPFARPELVKAHEYTDAGGVSVVVSEDDDDDDDDNIDNDDGTDDGTGRPKPQPRTTPRTPGDSHHDNDSHDNHHEEHPGMVSLLSVDEHH